jgi:hypothetical protein
MGQVTRADRLGFHIVVHGVPLTGALSTSPRLW